MGAGAHPGMMMMMMMMMMSPGTVRTMVRPRSAPYLRKKEVIRPNWNARHQILDTQGNWDDQLIYELVHASSLGREYASRVLKKARKRSLFEHVRDIADVQKGLDPKARKRKSKKLAELDDDEFPGPARNEIIL